LETDLCWVILGLVRSLGNFGTLIRTSEAIGGAGFILLDRAVDPYDPVTVRATMGSLFRQQFVRTTTTKPFNAGYKSTTAVSLVHRQMGPITFTNLHIPGQHYCFLVKNDRGFPRSNGQRVIILSEFQWSVRRILLIWG
jgi:TrmH family RNA methyltransferase